MHHAVLLPIASWEPRTCCGRRVLATDDRWEHEAAALMMINMTEFEVMAGSRWVVNLEEDDMVVFRVGPS